VEADVRCSRVSLPYGAGAPLVVRVRNHSRLPAPFVRVRLDLPAGLSAVPPGPPGDDDPAAGRCLSVCSLRGREEVEIQFAIYGHRRGRHRIQRVELTLFDGLTPRAHTAYQEIAAAVTIHPRPAPPSGRDRPDARRFGSVATRRKIVSSSLEWISMRPYQAGDALRDIAWTVSARRGELTVLERSLAVTPRILFVLNVQGSPDYWQPASPLAESVISAAYGTALQILNEETNLRIVANAVWYGRRRAREWSMLDMTGPVTPTGRERMGHFLGSLSTHPEVPLSELLKRIRLASWPPGELILFSGYEDDVSRNELLRLERRGYRVVRVPVAPIGDSRERPECVT
jgi:uncharacterized protein (DUF58 family)